MSDINYEAMSEIPGVQAVEKIDALNEKEVESYLDSVVMKSGTIEVVVNLSGSNPADYNHGKPAWKYPLTSF